MQKKQMPWWAVLAGGTILIILVGFVFSFFNIAGEQTLPAARSQMLLKILLWGPLLGTLEGILVPYEMVTAGCGGVFKKEYPAASVIFAALMYGLMHLTSPLFFLYSTACGLILSCSYLMFRNAKGWWFAAIMTFAMQLLVNLVSFGINAL